MCDGLDDQPLRDALPASAAAGRQATTFRVPELSTPLGGVAYSIPAYDREYQGMLNLDYASDAKAHV